MTLPARPVLIRYALVALTAWLLPSYAVVLAMTVRDWLTLGWPTANGEPLVDPRLLRYGPLLGLLFGWPCFLLG